ncbi:MAG: hypothetical protein JST54_24000 [Deltaproteobacteria bacterium]|nr:hypothetical protein [Deltaproteobacteria bacterium]
MTWRFEWVVVVAALWMTTGCFQAAETQLTSSSSGATSSASSTSTSSTTGTSGNTTGSSGTSSTSTTSSSSSSSSTTGSSGGTTGVAGTGAIVGQLDGSTRVAASVISADSEWNGHSTAYIILSDSADACGDLAAGPFANSDALLFQLYTITPDGGSEAPSAPGVFTLTVPTQPGLETGVGNFYEFGASCLSYVEESRSGTVTLTSVNNGQYAGTFDLVVRANNSSVSDHITGSFDTSFCQNLADATNNVEHVLPVTACP